MFVVTVSKLIYQPSYISMVTGLDLPGFLGGSNFLLPWDVTVRAEKDKWPAIGEVVGKKAKQKRAKQGTGRIKKILTHKNCCNYPKI